MKVKMFDEFEILKKPTIYQALKNKLGREPTNSEIKSEVSRILNDAMVERKKHSWTRKNKCFR